MRAFFRFVRAHPWISVCISLVLGLALAVILGLPAVEARGWLVGGIIGLVVAKVLAYSWRQSKKAEALELAKRAQSPVPQKRTIWQIIGSVLGGGFFILLAMLYLAGHIEERRKTNEEIAARGAQFDKEVPKMAAELFKARARTAAATEQYWQTTVAALHAYRFHGPADTSENAMAAVRRRLAQAQDAIVKAKAAPSANVDPELVAMVKRHLQADEASLKMNLIVLKYMDEMAARPDVKPITDRTSYKEMIDRGLKYAEQPDAPEDVKQLTQLTAERMELYAQALHDIEIMQAKLRERYKSESWFNLPPTPIQR